jgi:hypothetical protein
MGPTGPIIEPTPFPCPPGSTGALCATGPIGPTSVPCPTGPIGAPVSYVGFYYPPPSDPPAPLAIPPGTVCYEMPRGIACFSQQSGQGCLLTLYAPGAGVSCTPVPPGATCVPLQTADGTTTCYPVCPVGQTRLPIVGITDIYPSPIFPMTL